ncbi:hypothetical protein [Helicobacter winghamensis]|uniref:hypothetical protein n=1 Tax=Helicobacter winghamensis TaxID=157268 RepID=UPI001E373ECA|nr:hypothetical protein [Helicobacter winghamensis]
MFQWYDDKKELLGILMPCALVMHIGMVVIADCLKKTGKHQSFAQEFDAETFLESEAAFLSCNQFEVLELLFEHWHFEHTMTQVAHFLLQEDCPSELEPYLYPLRVVNTLINPFSVANPMQINQSLQKIRHYKLNAEKFNTTLENIAALQENL